MKRRLTKSKLTSVVEWSYDKAINGVSGLESAEELADKFHNTNRSAIEQANRLIQTQSLNSAISGFLTGLGGLVTMPVLVPANISSLIFIQIRLIAAIAHLGGHDLKNEMVKTSVICCLAGNVVNDAAKELGVLLATQMTSGVIRCISGNTLVSINNKVGFRLFTKFGEHGVINLGKFVPIAGALVGSSMDYCLTRTVGNLAREIFIGNNR